MNNSLIPEDDIIDATSDDATTHNNNIINAIEALDSALSIKPSTKKDVDDRGAKVNIAVSNLEVAILKDAQTFEDKEYIQKRLKDMIDMGTNMLKEIEKDCKNGGASPRVFEVFATLMNSTTVSCNQLLNLQKIAAEAAEYRNSSGNHQNAGMSITETHSRTVNMGPREMADFIAKTQKGILTP